MTRQFRGNTAIVSLSIASGGSALLASRLLDQPDLSAWARLAIALIPVPFFIGFLVLLWRVATLLDEFNRQIQLEALIIALGLMAIASVAAKYLDRAGFLELNGWDAVWPAIGAAYLVGLALAYWRYR
jgi:hypothetical protein